METPPQNHVIPGTAHLARLRLLLWFILAGTLAGLLMHPAYLNSLLNRYFNRKRAMLPAAPFHAQTEDIAHEETSPSSSGTAPRTPVNYSGAWLTLRIMATLDYGNDLSLHGANGFTDGRYIVVFMSSAKNTGTASHDLRSEPTLTDSKGRSCPEECRVPDASDNEHE